MQIADNILKKHLKNVYFISGSACSGKTTVAKYIAEKCDMIFYSEDEHFGDYRKISDSINQPEMNKNYSSWDEYFNRNPKEYSESLSKSLTECLDFVIVDLIKLSEKNKVIVEGDFPVDYLQRISDRSRCVFLLVEYNLMRKDFFAREDKTDIFECIMSLANPNRILNNVLDAVTYNHKEYMEEVIESGMNYFIRTDSTDYNIYKKQVIRSLGLE